MGIEDIVRVGIVSDVDKDGHMARVIFEGQKSMVSDWLPVLKNPPLITIEKTVDGETWDYDATYSSFDRELGLGEKYQKGGPDVIINSKDITYEKKQSIGSCALTGVLEIKTHTETVTVYPWLPYIDQVVICLYLPVFNGAGYIIGGL